MQHRWSVVIFNLTTAPHSHWQPKVEYASAARTITAQYVQAIIAFQISVRHQCVPGANDSKQQKSILKDSQRTCMRKCCDDMKHVQSVRPLGSLEKLSKFLPSLVVSVTVQLLDRTKGLLWCTTVLPTEVTSDDLQPTLLVFVIVIARTLSRVVAHRKQIRH